MGLFETGHAAAEIVELRMRTKRVRAKLEHQIQSEGGQILSIRSLNSRLILHSPFPSKLIRVNTIGGRPVLLQIRVRYPIDAGSWFIFAPNDRPVRWAWKSYGGRTELPVARGEGALVTNDVIALPLWASGLAYLSLVAAVAAIVIYINRR